MKMAKYSFSEHQFKFEDSNDPKLKHLVLLDMNDPETLKVHQWYERACTAEYLIENEDYAPIFDWDENIAFKIACDVRDYMDNNLVTESDAISEIFKNFNIEKYR